MGDGEISVRIQEGSPTVTRIREELKPLVRCLKDEAKEAMKVNEVKPSCTILRVPENLRVQLSAGDDRSNVPEVVSLGPYHSEHEHLKIMNSQKVRALNSVINQSRRTIDEYVDTIDKLKVRAYECYQGLGDLNNDFVKMLLLDGCFILEIIQGHNFGFESFGYPPGDAVFSKRGYNKMASAIIKDMTKPENQIPFFVLEELFKLQKGKAGELAKSAALMFLKWLTGEELERKYMTGFASGDGEFLHCLHVFHRILCLGLKKDADVNDPSDNSSTADFQNKLDRFFHSATDLIEYGIKLKQYGKERRLDEHEIELRQQSNDQREDEYVIELKQQGKKQGLNEDVKLQIKGRRPFWDIRFKNGTLEMPRLFINGRVKSAFPNLIIFEQQGKRLKKEVDPIVTEYVAFMDKLMSSSRDVAHLHNSGIIVHQLRGDAEVANLFNDLGKAAFLQPNVKSHYSELYVKINNHCSKTHRWKSELKRKYFRNPWTSISLFAAIALLLLTFVQTYYTVYPYYWPRKQS